MGTGSGVLTIHSLDDRLGIDFDARSAYVNDIEVNLTRTEFDILAILASQLGRAIPNREIISAVWGEWYGSVDHVFVHIHHIRRKLGPCGRLVRNRRGVGYILERGRSSPGRAIIPGPFSTEFIDWLQRDAGSRDVVWLLGGDSGEVTWVSESVTRLMGWAPSTLIGRRPQEFIYDRNYHVPHVIPESLGLTVFTHSVRLTTSLGHPVLAQVTAQVFRGADGAHEWRLGEWVVSSRETHHGSDSPEVATDRVRLSFDLDSTLLAVEPHRPFLGWQPEQIIGTYFSLAGLDPLTSVGVIRALVASGQFETKGEITAICGDGSRVLVDVRIRLIVEEATVVGYSGEAAWAGSISAGARPCAGQAMSAEAALPPARS
jgi:hypothetical protein